MVHKNTVIVCISQRAGCWFSVFTSLKVFCKPSFISFRAKHDSRTGAIKYVQCNLKLFTDDDVTKREAEVTLFTLLAV